MSFWALNVCDTEPTTRLELKQQETNDESVGYRLSRKQ